MRTQKTRKLVSVLLGVLVVGGFGGGVVLGWHWVRELKCSRIDVEGWTHAAPEEVRALARVDTGMVLYQIEPEIVEDRVQRHPWVEAAEVVRRPSGTLTIRVTERTPVLLVLDEAGWPAYYLDRAGFAMPLVPEAVFDTPLLRGLGAAYHPTRPVRQGPVRNLLHAIDEAAPPTHALVSELGLRSDGEVWLRTTAIDARGSFTARLGREAFDEKLRRLHAFWHQAILTQPEKTFSLIDLRFDGLIFTQEKQDDGTDEEKDLGPLSAARMVRGASPQTEQDYATQRHASSRPSPRYHE